jgi:ABC-2 type transport system permease protein
MLPLLRRVGFLARKDLKFMMKAPETLVWLFVMPFVFFFFIGNMTGGFGGGPPQGEIMGVWSEDGGPLLAPIEARLDSLGYVIRHPDSLAQFERYRRQLLFPAAFSDSVLTGNQATVTYRNTDEDPLRGQYDDIRIQRALYETLADVVLVARDEAPLTEETFMERQGRPGLIGLQVEQAGSRRDPPVGFQQAVPGTMVMFILLIMFTSGTYMLVAERKEGALKRLAAAPVRRGEIVAAKGLSRMGLGVVQILVGLLAGALIFKVDWGEHPVALFLILLVYGGMAAMLAIILGSVVRTAGQAIGIGVLVTNVIAALGGCWWPIEVTPLWMQKLAMLLPTGWAMDAMHRLTSFGDSPSAVIPHGLMLLGSTALLIWVGNRVFKYE